MKGFKNSWIITEEGKIKGNLIIEDGLIKALGNDTTDNLVELNEDLVVIPGFIDEHIHGAAGSDAMDGTIEDLKKIPSMDEKSARSVYNFFRSDTKDQDESLEKR